MICTTATTAKHLPQRNSLKLHRILFMCCRLVAIVTRLKIDASYRQSCNMPCKHFAQLKQCICIIMLMRSRNDTLNKRNVCEEQI